MAFSIIPKPGSTLGPCEDSCHHRDCKAMRDRAMSRCYLCGKPIGYDKGQADYNGHTSHNVCLEEWAESKKEWPTHEAPATPNDESFSADGSPLPKGRCDECGKPQHDGTCLEMTCPKCGEDDRLYIAATVMVLMTHEGSDANGSDHEYNPNSHAHCGCGWSGTVENLVSTYDASFSQRPN